MSGAVGRWIERLDRGVQRAEMGILVALMALLTFITFAQVVFRYAFNSPLTWSEEAARYLFVWTSMIGAGAAVARGTHYGLDGLLRAVPRRWARLFGVAATSVVFVVATALFVTGIAETVLASRQFSASLPMRMHWAYAALPCGAALMMWHTAVLWIRRGPGQHPLDRA